MRRREFISLFGTAAAAWPLTARAQQSAKMARIGMLMGLPEGDPEGERWVKAFVEGLSQSGWKRDSNVKIDLRWGGANPDQMQKMAKELVESGPDVINVTTTPATAAVLREPHPIPVVFSVVSEPVGAGFVQNFPRPGGNATGFVNIEASVGGKWLGILREIAPRTSRVSIMFNPKTSPQSVFYLKSLEPAAASMALPLTVAPIGNASDITTAIKDLAQFPDAGIVVTPDVFTFA